MEKNSNFGPKNSKVGSKNVKLAQNSDAVKIGGFPNTIEPIWAILGQIERLERIESCSRIWKKILKKSNFGPKNSKVGSKSVKLAQNSDPLEIEAFSDNFGNSGPN